MFLSLTLVEKKKQKKRWSKSTKRRKQKKKEDGQLVAGLPVRARAHLLGSSKVVPASIALRATSQENHL